MANVDSFMQSSAGNMICYDLTRQKSKATEV